MAKLVPEEHPALHTIAEEVSVAEITSAHIKKILKDMRTALDSYNVDGFRGVAIAAPQIGIPLRIVLVHDTDRNHPDALPDVIAINHRILKVTKKTHVVGEGCLSVEERYGAVKRATHATLRAYDENGKEYERGARGLLAQIFQHETDHLDGILFVDRAEKVWNKDDAHAQKLSEAKHTHDA